MQWFNQLLDAARNDRLALMSCLDKATGEARSVICLVSIQGDEALFTPVGHLCPEDNPYDAYTPPEGDDIDIQESVH